ncbi:alpha/beta hydrolase [Luteibacter aegosomaticola]|uniref:alpha/beta fold hydrolase n=1 Tax=Luteibacter aegosomaticola TaxID=2911538 RepID=UPI001FF78358|nr:alpha/beta fold hydrolase [Luteibacter aegosomaticola]UPG90313.1 alpha/beta hydrolase [Luteibacter aegosomaticola]
MSMLRHFVTTAGAISAAVIAAPLAASRTDAFATPEMQPQTITWTSCHTGNVALLASELGDRLRCGTLTAPLDHHRPETGNITLSVVRIAVADSTKRQGALFVNPGGPGGDAGEFAGMLAAFWLDAPAADPVHGDKRRILDQFDIVAVIPRGMPGSTPLVCQVNLPRTDFIMTDRSEQNVAAWDLVGRRLSEGCRADPRYPFISTEQTVYDHELVRRSLGEPVFNFYGVSYGTWLGAWYGATYPAKVGRMVLDSPMDFTATFEENHLAAGPALQEVFDRRVARPAAADPARYGLGASETAVRDVLRQLVPRVHEAWVRRFDAPEDLMAAKTASDWLRADPSLDKAGMSAGIDAWVYSEDSALNRRARAAARAALDRIFAPSGAEAGRLSARSAMITTVPCNDTVATADAGQWQDVIARQARDYPARSSAGLMNPCVFSHGPNAVKPPVDRLARAGRILILASEFDTITPIAGAVRMINALPNAKMLVLRGGSDHMLFAMTEQACIERSTARFLVDGRTPTSQLTECLVDVDPARPAPDAPTGGTAAWQARRAQLREIAGGDALAALFSPLAVRSGDTADASE